MKNLWWKILAVICILYALYEGLTAEVPRLPVLNETIRNLYYHVGMWFGMIALMTGSMIYAIISNNSKKISHFIISTQLAHVGVLYGILGLLTGMLWGNYTWGSPWPNDPKIHGAALSVVIYLAYFRLQSGVEDPEKKLKISAAYNIIAYLLLVLFLIVYPRMTESLHPGSGGNPGFNTYDLDSNMRKVFYPAILGWILVGFWIAQLKIRYELLAQHQLIKELDEGK